MTKTYNFIMRAGLFFLIIFTPLAFGTVQPWSITIMELVTLLMALSWFLKMIHNGEFRFIKTPLNIPLLLFALFVLFQLLPFPQALIKYLSPNTYDLYQMTVPDYNIENNIEPQTSALNRKYKTLTVYKHATRNELFRLLTYLAVFFLVINHFRRQEDLSRLITLVIALGFVLSVFALIQNLSGTDKIYWFQKLSQRGSPYGPYVNPNHFAGYISMVIPLALGFLISRSYSYNAYPFTGRHYLSSNSRFLISNFLFLFSITIMITALFLSLSRGGMFSLILSLIVMLNLLLVRQYSRMRIYIIPFSVLLFAFFFLAHLGINPVIQRLSTLFHLEQEMSATARFTVWQDTLTAIKDYPLVGTGLGTFQYIFPKYRAASSEIHLYFDYAHNDYLQLMQESGLIGFGLIILGLIVFFWKVFTKWKERHNPFVKALTMGALAAVFSMLLHSLVDFNLHIPANALFFFLTLALAFNIVQCRDGMAPAQKN